MNYIDDITEKREYLSDRKCDLCNSQEGLVRRVGNYIVDLSEIVVKDGVRLACQGCKIKEHNFRKTKEKHQKGNSFLKKLFKFGY